MDRVSPSVAKATLPRYENDTAALRHAFSLFPSGVVSLIARTNGKIEGMIAPHLAAAVA